MLGLAPDGAAQAGPPPRLLRVQVRDTAPGASPNFLHERDRSYTVSTGSGGDQDERLDARANNATVLSTSNSIRLVRVQEGEPIRVDLPSVQTLQFHVPLGKTAAPSRGASAPGAVGSKAPSGVSGPAASAVVYFEAVSAFAARFVLAGNNVRIELVPLQIGGVAAPFVAGSGGESLRAVTLFGRVGEWIALGDLNLVSTGKSLSVTAEPPSQPSVWVRVEPDPAARP
ncbi:MAG TPA: hypothetical protein VEI29_09030 [Burkholderiaceae bacterium]|nr:hypothetical protein [Burkholderiaceae bacterium]